MPDDKKSAEDKTKPVENVSQKNDRTVTESTNSPDVTFKPTLVSDDAATAEAPESQLAKDESLKEDVENRRTRISSDLLQQKHALINSAGGILLVVIVALYLIFSITLMMLLLSGKAFEKDIHVTGVILLGMCGSVPTILSISLIVGLLAKEKESAKEEKSILDSSMVAKMCFEVIKYMKTPH